nr:urea ABC transporter permease subunit UrtB [Sneathiella glossodoripedis]
MSADSAGELVSGIAQKSFSKKAAAVEKLASSGNENAALILNALMQGNLYRVKTDSTRVVLVLSEEGSLKISDPVTGAEFPSLTKSDLKKIRINNKVRSAIKAGLGRLDLTHIDPDRRLSAAAAVFKSGDPTMLPVLEELLSKEQDEHVKSAFKIAVASLQLINGQDKKIRLKAVETLQDAGGQEVKGLLSKAALQLATEKSEGSAEIAKAVEKALASVDRQLATYGMVENLFQGLSLGSVLLLAAIGLAITFGVMGVINMAHGEMVMIGAYTTYVIQETCRLYMPGVLDYSLIVAIPLAFLVSGLFGILLERSVIRFLYGRPLETLLATWGISLILQQFVRTIFGPTNKEVSTPSWLSGAWEITSGLSVTYNRLAIIVFALLVLFFLMLVLKKTLFGLQMRAVTQNRMMARSMGVRSASVDALTFGLGSGVAGMAGVALSQIDNVSPNLGQAYIIDSFMVVVFGGVGNLWGTLVGAGSLGIVNKFLEPYSGAVLAKILVLVAIILFIQKRPRGLFALKGRSVEG